MGNELILTIHGRNGIVFSGAVSSLSSVNGSGQFDIFPLHSNFISLINNKINYKDAITKQNHEVVIGQAILKANENQVNIYLGLSS